MRRGDLHTAFGGTQLGMSVPLAGLSLVLSTFGGSFAGITERTTALPLAALSMLAALLLATSGSLLLWGHLLDALDAPPRPAPARPRAAARIRSKRNRVPPPRRVPAPLLASVSLRPVARHA